MDFQELFEYMSNEHGVILLESDMWEIVRIVREMIEKDSNDLSYRKTSG